MYIKARQNLDIWYTIKKILYKPISNCTYWPVTGSLNIWNIIQLSHESTPFEAFEEIHKVILDRISDDMVSLFQYGKYGAINTTDTATNGFYVVMFTP